MWPWSKSTIDLGQLQSGSLVLVDNGRYDLEKRKVITLFQKGALTDRPSYDTWWNGSSHYLDYYDRSHLFYWNSNLYHKARNLKDKVRHLEKQARDSMNEEWESLIKSLRLIDPTADNGGDE